MTFRLIVDTDVQPITERPAAVTAYTAAVTKNRHAHVTLIEGDALPGIPPKVIAERFGNPPEDHEPQYVGP